MLACLVVAAFIFCKSFAHVGSGMLGNFFGNQSRSGLRLVMKPEVSGPNDGWICPAASKEHSPSAGEAHGDPSLALRQCMVDEQLGWDINPIRNPVVLDAMRKVPRHQLVPEDVRHLAYADRPLPIGYGQTISQPYIVAFMTAVLEPQPCDRVLEIGTGSGYQAAVLAAIVAEVWTVEIVPALASRAAADLKRLGCTNVHVRHGDGGNGWAEAAPFDAIIVTCAPQAVPGPLVGQLNPGGRMIIPVGPAGDQQLILLRKFGDHLEQQAVLPVRFVPMTGEALSPRL